MRIAARFQVLLPLLLCLAPALPAGAQNASLLRDIAAGSVTFPAEDSQPTQLTAVGKRVFFHAFEPNSGGEVWASDGTALGTQLLANVCPGPCSSEFHPLGSAGNIFLWLTTEEDSGPFRLWRSDGTPAGTYRLVDSIIDARESEFDERRHGSGGGTVYFQGCTREAGCEPWRSDGTAAGTRMIADVEPGSGSSFFLEPTVAAGKVFFIGSFQGSATALWVSDGTPEGTKALKVIPSIRNLTAAEDKLFFLGPTEEGRGVWVSDGTPAGTHPVASFNTPYPFGSEPLLKAVGKRLYFVAGELEKGYDLWRSDGTVAGTAPLTNLGSVYPFSSRRQSWLEEAGDRVMFFVQDDHSWYLYSSAGTAETTISLKRICTDCSFPSQGLAKAGSRVVFPAEDRDVGYEMWSTDGTPRGTVLLADLCPGSCGGAVTQPFPQQGAAFFAASTRQGIDWWRTDGTAEGTKRFTWGSGGPPFGRDPEIVSVDGKIFFASEDDLGDELWTADGTPEGTRLVMDIAQRANSSQPRDFAALGDQLFFFACGLWKSAGTPESTLPVPGTGEDCSPGPRPNETTALGNLVFFRQGSVYDRQLWRTDGTAEGTQRLTDESITVDAFTVFKGKLFFAARASFGAPGTIWSSDGTPEGTGKALDLPGLNVEGPMYAVGPELYFVGRETFGGSELWRSDGTAAGTRRITQSASLGPSLSHFARVGSFVYFIAGNALFRTDGTLAGTVRVEDAQNMVGLGTADFAVLHGEVYFMAHFTKRTLWKTNGTPEGTVRIRDFDTDDIFTSDELETFQDQIFFTVDDGEHGNELWKSDGTAAGTVLVSDLRPGLAGSHPAWLTAAGGRLFFSAGESAHGVELWQTDGTAEGTRLVQDIAPLGSSSDPQKLTVAGGHLFFSADDGVSGRELWALPLGTGEPACRPSDRSLCLNGGRFRVEAVWEDFSRHAGYGHAVALTPDTGYFWFFNPENLEVVLKVLDGRGSNGHFWVFYGALSNVAYSLTVTDTQTGLSRRYSNPPKQFASVGDNHGFGPLGAYGSKSIAPAGSPLLVSEQVNAAAATGTCVPSAGRLCLNGGRFAVESKWKLPDRNGTGKAVSLTGDTGYFWFFQDTNVETVIKVLDGRERNGHFWVFYGALTNVEYEFTVTDTVTGKVRTYKNPRGQFASAGDTTAF